MFYDMEPLLVVMLCLHPILVGGAWIYLYAKGRPTRDMLFWGVIVLAVPYLGPIIMVIFFRQREEKRARLNSSCG